MTPLRHKQESIYDLEREDEVLIGTIPYRVKGFARGGMGFILFLERTSHPRQPSVHGPRLAVKAILADSTEDALQMFRKELMVWAGFRHPHILNLNEILEADQSWVAAMDWGTGSLRNHLQHHGPLPVTAATQIILDTIEALNYAYLKDGVHHLDLKPENLISNRFFEGRFMVSDWGIASVKKEALSRLVEVDACREQCGQTLNNIGTVLYMAPERFVKGYRSSAGSDIFSLGMMYLELLTGALPFDRQSSAIEQLLSHIYVARIKAIAGNSKLPKPIEDLILSCVCPDPNRRIATYRELGTRLIRVTRNASGFLSRIFGN